MKLLRFVGGLPADNKVYDELKAEEMRGYFGAPVAFAEVGQLPDSGATKNLKGFVAECETWSEFLIHPIASEYADRVGAYKALIERLRNAADTILDAPTPPEPDERIRYRDPRAVRREVRRYLDWARAALPHCPDDEEKRTAANKSNGRRKADESPSGVKIVAALTLLHQIDENGSVGKWGPFTGRRIAEEAGVSAMAVTRFFQSKFKVEKNAYSKYKIACQRDAIGRFIVVWREEKLSPRVSLRDDD